MKNEALRHDPLTLQLKHFIVDTLKLHNIEADNIADDEPLVGGRIGLDSLDAIELFMCLEEEYGIMICSKDESLAALASVANLAGFIRAHVPGEPASHPAQLAMGVSA